MKKSFINVSLFLTFLVGWLWLCCSFPEAVTGMFESLGVIFVGLLIAAFALGPFLTFIASLFSTPPPPAHPPAPPPVTPPVRKRDTLTPLLLGLALGWWLGGGPGDGGDGC